MMNLVIDGSYGLAKPCENVETEKRLRKEEKEKRDNGIQVVAKNNDTLVF